MPTYQYSCADCGHFFEQVQSFSEDSLTVCPQCQGRLRKVFNAVGVVFKGSGFYRTDSRADSRTDAARSEGGKSRDGSSDGAREKKADGTGGRPGADGSGGAASSGGSGSSAARTPAGTSAA
jgi:putative FmdB family regulatory protein